MNQIVTKAVVLSRLNFGEADKILTLLTPDQGKIRVLARGVRKIKSKLAGGIELFSVSTVTYIPGKKDIGTLVSTRLQTHFNHIIEDIDRTMLGYDILKYLNKTTQDLCDQDYYALLVQTLADINDFQIDQKLTKCWFMARLLYLMGHSPNCETDVDGNQLDESKSYQFDYQQMRFYQNSKGLIASNHIKVLRLLLIESPEKLRVIKDIHKLLPDIEMILHQSLENYIQ